MLILLWIFALFSMEVSIPDYHKICSICEFRNFRKVQTEMNEALNLNFFSTDTHTSVQI